MKKKFWIGLGALVLLGAGWGFWQSSQQGEQAPWPKSGLTLDEVVQVVERRYRAPGEDGFVSLRDQDDGTVHDLKLVKIHKERLSPVGDCEYFVCADFERRDGYVYDLDMFVNCNEDVYDVTYHKDDGKARYTWALDEQTGTWHRQSI